jgi:hypothetical protein
MLIIREEQYKALSQYVVKTFETRVLAHLRQIWAEDCQKLGERTVRESIQKSLERCAGYGLRTEIDVVRFVDLTFVLCQDFDTNPRIAWAARILNDKELASGAKMDRLWEKAEQDLIAMELRQTKKA